MALWDIRGGALQGGTSSSASTFVNNAGLVFGSGSGGTASDISAAATSDPSAPTTSGTSGTPTDSYGVTATQAPFSISSLLSSQTFWLAAGAILTLWLILRKKKG